MQMHKWLHQSPDGLLHSQDVNMLVKTNPLSDNSPGAGDTFPLAAGQHKELYVNELMGKYYAMMRRGRVFNASTVVAGVAIPISTTTNGIVFGLWNPAGSGVLMVPLLFNFSLVSGTAVQTSIDLAIVANAGNAIATAAPLSAFTSVAPINALYGMGTTGQVRGCSAATVTTAGVFLQSIGANTYTGATTVPVGIAPIQSYDFHGTLGIPPGNFVYVMGNAASSALYQQTFIFAELPFGGNI